MNLRSQQQKQYNVFNINEEISEKEEIVLLQMMLESMDVQEQTFDELEQEYMFLTETLGWKEGPNKRNMTEEDTKNITKLAEYLFVTAQMGWRKGLKIFKEKGEGAIMKELQ